MKKSKRVALCGMISALAIVFLLAAYFPYLTFALPAIAGAMFMILLVEIGAKWAFVAYAATSLLSAILIFSLESTWLFIGFFGYYPIVKAFYEKSRSRIVEYLLKFVTFNAAVVITYLVIIFVVGIPLDGMELFGRYTLLILLALGNLMFFIYDLALSRFYDEYMGRLHLRIVRLLK